MQIIWQKLKQTKLHVFVTAAILAVVFVLALLDLNRTYEAQMTVIVLPKSELAASQLEKITTNVAAFPQMLSFYERMLQDNPRMLDPYAGKEAAVKKQLWNENVEIATIRYSRSSLVAMQVTAATAEQARNLVLKSTQTLLAMTSRYYNFEKDLDLRVVDGPIVKAQTTAWFWLVPLGIAAGAVCAWILETVLLMLENALRRQWNVRRAARKMHERFKSVQESIFAPKLPEIEKIEDIYKEKGGEVEQIASPGQVEVIPEIEQLHRKKEASIYPNFPEMPVHGTKKAAAPENLPILGATEMMDAELAAPVANVPGNLPIAEELPAYLFGGQSKEEKTEAPTEQAEKMEEPTVEELKQRLNQLLRGE